MPTSTERQRARRTSADTALLSGTTSARAPSRTSPRRTRALLRDVCEGRAAAASRPPSPAPTPAQASTDLARQGGLAPAGLHTTTADTARRPATTSERASCGISAPQGLGQLLHDIAPQPVHRGRERHQGHASASSGHQAGLWAGPWLPSRANCTASVGNLRVRRRTRQGQMQRSWQQPGNFGGRARAMTRAIPTHRRLGLRRARRRKRPPSPSVRRGRVTSAPAIVLCRVRQ